MLGVAWLGFWGWFGWVWLGWFGLVIEIGCFLKTYIAILGIGNSLHLVNNTRSEVFFQWNICRRIMHLGWVLVLVWLVLRFFVPEMGSFSFNIKDIQDV